MRSGAQSLAGLAEQVRPVTLTREQRLPVLPALGALLPGGGLRRGSTVAVAGVARGGRGHVAGPGAGGRRLAGRVLGGRGGPALAGAGGGRRARRGPGAARAGRRPRARRLGERGGRAGRRLRPASSLPAGRGACARPTPGGWWPGPGSGVRCSCSWAVAGRSGPTWSSRSPGPDGRASRRATATSGPARSGWRAAAGEAARPRRVDLWLPAPGGAIEVAAPSCPVAAVPASGAASRAPAPEPSRPARRDRPLRAVS